MQLVIQVHRVLQVQHMYESSGLAEQYITCSLVNITDGRPGLLAQILLFFHVTNPPITAAHVINETQRALNE